MVQQIQVGNDILEFPDNMPDEQITAVIKKEYPQNGQQTQTTQPEISGQPDEGFQARNQRVVSQVAMGVPQGLGNAAIGAFQAATDFGEKAASLIERLYYGDNLNMNTFGDRLAEQVKLKNEQQAQLPTAERVGVAIGQALPYLTTGVGTGAKVAQVAGKVAGLAAGGAVGGAVSSALSPQEEAGLENRAIETVKGAVIGGSIGGGLGVIGKVGGNLKSGAAQLGKDVLAGYKARPAEALAGFTSKPVETLDSISEAIKEGSSSAYKAMREAGAILKPETTKSIFMNIDDSLKESGILNPRLHGDTIGVLDDLKALAKEKNGAIGLEELDQYRQLLGDVVKKNTDIGGKINADALKANIAINKLDDVVENLGGNALVSNGIQTNLAKPTELRLYRGLQQDFDKNFDLKLTDAPNGYSTWTDNPELAKQYAGKAGKVYQIDLPKKELGKELVNEEGERALFVNNQKPAGLNNISGKEYLVYNDSELYNPNLVKEFKIKSTGGDQKSLDLLNTAREEWKRYRKFDAITNIVRKADGDANRTKTLLQNFVNNPKNLRGFSPAEVEALKRAKTNSTAEGLMKAIGKFGFDIGSARNAGNSALPIGSILIGGGTGGLIAAVGTVARQAQKLSARGQIDDVLRLIQGQEPKVASKVVQQLPPKTRDFVLTNILTQSINQ